MLSPEQAQIVERAQQPHYAGHLEHFTHEAEGANLSCGDEIRFELQVDEFDNIKAARHSGRSCSICTASADFLVEVLEGCPLAELAALEVEKHIASLDIPLSPLRQKCAALPIETLKRLTKVDQT